MGFAFKDYPQVWTAIDGDLGDYIRSQIAAKAGLVPMEKRWDLGFRQITTSAKPIEKAADLAGLKLRVPGAPALVSLFTALGASPVSMQFGEVYTSLQTQDRRRPGESAVGDRRRKVLRGAEILRRSPTTSGTATGSAPIPLRGTGCRTTSRRSSRRRSTKSRCWSATTSNKLDRSLQAELEKKGVTFTKPDLDTLPRQAARGRASTRNGAARSATRPGRCSRSTSASWPDLKRRARNPTGERLLRCLAPLARGAYRGGVRQGGQRIHDQLALRPGP